MGGCCEVTVLGRDQALREASPPSPTQQHRNHPAPAPARQPLLPPTSPAPVMHSLLREGGIGP